MGSYEKKKKKPSRELGVFVAHFRGHHQVLRLYESLNSDPGALQESSNCQLDGEILRNLWLHQTCPVLGTLAEVQKQHGRPTRELYGGVPKKRGVPNHPKLDSLSIEPNGFRCQFFWITHVNFKGKVFLVMEWEMG